jgi:putative phage-type endonuclease
MKIINLIQGSPQWLSWRKEGIGASEIAAVMGVSTYAKPLDIYKRKVPDSKETFLNIAMKHGNEEEPKARKWLENFYEITFDSLCAEDETHSFLRCSFDAINLDSKILIEIKCPFNSIKLEEMKGGVFPNDYIYQLQYQMKISGIEKGFIAVWDGSTCHLHEFKADKKLWKSMEKAASSFWNDFIRGIEPIATHADISNEHVDLLEKADVLRTLKSEIKEKTSIAKEIETEFKALSNGQNILLHGIKVTIVGGATSYDYDRMLSDGIDLDKYKKIGSPYCRINA